jgi:hypothetical protein
MNVRDRVDKLEQILIGIKSDTADPITSNRLEQAINFMTDIATEVVKTQELLNSLMREMTSKDIISGTRLDRLKVEAEANTNLVLLKEKLASIIRRENELEGLGPIPEGLRVDTRAAKEALCLKIDELETELRRVQ